MFRMKKKTIITAMAATAVMFGCTAKFEEYNTDPYAIQSGDPEVLLPSMIETLMFTQQNNSQMIDQMVGTLGGYFTLSNRWGGQNFDTFNVSDQWNCGPYETPFTAIYTNYFEIADRTGNSGHYYALATLVKAASMMRVADCYGPIPYSKVRDGQMYVEYDTNEDVYRNIITDLLNSASTLYAYSVENPGDKPLGSGDLIYGGDYSLWAKLANSYAMRAAMRSGDQESFISAMENSGGYIDDNSDNAMMDPSVQTNPYYLASASWGDLRTNASIVDYMNGYSDPRLDAYFTNCTYQGYTGVKMGMRSGSASFNRDEVLQYSMPNFTSTTRLPVFVAAESEFLIAEAAVRGWISEDPQTHYENGIRLSMSQWGATGDTDYYISNTTAVPADHKDFRSGQEYDRSTEVTVAWDSSAADEEKIEKIITQKWIAMYPMGLEAWAEYRRTGYPELCPAIDNLSDGVIGTTGDDMARGMRRLRYPYTERDYNLSNYTAAVQMLGGTDNESVDLFWTRKKNQ